MKKILFGLLILLMVTGALAQENDQFISMKTNEKITAIFNLKNLETDELRKCFVYFNGDLRDLNWVRVDPVTISNIAPKENIDINVIFDGPTESGYYVDELQISCERWFESKFVERTNILSSQDAPDFIVLVGIAGEGQDYALKPNNPTWTFVAKAGDVKKVVITVANTGSVVLPVKVVLPSTDFKVTPEQSLVDPEEFKNFQFEYTAPPGFSGATSEIQLMVGDFKEVIPVEGKTGFGGFFFGGTFSLIESTVDVGGFKIPILGAVFVFAVAAYLYYIKFVKKQKKGKKK